MNPRSLKIHITALWKASMAITITVVFLGNNPVVVIFKNKKNPIPVVPEVKIHI